MTIAQKLQIMKFFKILLIIFLIPTLLFYIFLIIPEYTACNDSMFEGEKGIDIWGSLVACDSESRAFSVAFFQIFSIIILVTSFVLILINIFSYRLKKNL